MQGSIHFSTTGNQQIEYRATIEIYETKQYGPFSSIP